MDGGAPLVAGKPTIASYSANTGVA